MGKLFKNIGLVIVTCFTLLLGFNGIVNGANQIDISINTNQDTIAYYNYNDEDSGNPYINNDSDLPLNVLLVASFPVLSNSDENNAYNNCLFDLSKINDTWSISKTEFKDSINNSDLPTIEVTYKYNKILNKGEQTDNLFSNLRAIDNLRVEQIKNLNNSFTVTYNATGSYSIPDADYSLPKTGNDSLINISLIFTAVIIILIVTTCKNKKHHSSLFLLLILISIAFCSLNNNVLASTITGQDNKTLTFNVDKQTYTISFDMGKATSTPIDTIEVAKNASISNYKPNDPTKKGYTFTGWTNNNNKFYFESNNRASGDLNIKANFEINSYILTYHLNNDNGTYADAYSVAARSVDYNDSIYKPTNADIAAKHDYNLAAWYYDEGLTEQVDFNTDLMPDKDVDLYARWEEIHTITFNTFGKCSIPEVISGVQPNNTLPTKPNVSASGYNFAGWYSDINCTVPFYFDDEAQLDPNKQATQVNSNMDLYAKWTPRTDTAFTINYYYQDTIGNGYTLDHSDDYTGKTDNKVFLSNSVPTGFKTSTVKSTTYSDSTHTASNNALTIKGDGSLIVNRYYDRLVYTVTFNANLPSSYQGDAPAIPDPKEYRYQATIASPTITIDGYNFEGWYKESAGTNKYDFVNESMPNNNLDLYAKYSAKGDTKYVVNHYKEKLDGSYELISEDKYGTTDTLATYNVNNYQGFEYKANKLTYTSNGKQIQSANIINDGSLNINLYYDRKIFNITFDSNFEGTEIANVPASQAIKYGGKVVNPNVTLINQGYDFKGWYKNDKTGMEANKYDFASLVMEADFTLYASFTPRNDTPYKVEYYQENVNDDGYTLFETENKLGVTNTYVTHPHKTYTGFIYAPSMDKYTDSSHIILSSDKLKINPDGSLTLKVYYKRATHNVTFSCNGHGFDPASLTNVKYGASINKPATLTGVVGYTHDDKWYKEQECANEFDFNEDTMLDEDITLYAKWVINKHNVIFNMNGHGLQIPQYNDVSYNSKIVIPTYPVDNNYEFGGWYKEANLTNFFDFNTEKLPDKDITLYASWYPKTSYKYKYAVSLYGVGVDAYKDGDGNIIEAGANNRSLTFGPALGESFISSYRSHVSPNSETASNKCIHNHTWEEILSIDPHCFNNCISNRCTKTIELTAKHTTTILNPKARATMNGDGPSALHSELYRYSTTDVVSYENLRWHPNNTESDRTYGTITGGWGVSRVRAMLNGVDTDNSDGITTDLKTNVYANDGLLGQNDIDKVPTVYTDLNNLYRTLPIVLQDHIVSKKVQYSCHDSKADYDAGRTPLNKVTYDKLWLLSYKELGSTYNPNEGTVYSRFNNFGNAANTLRVTYKIADIASTSASANTTRSWVRSTDHNRNASSANDGIFFINTDGSTSTGYGAAEWNFGISFAFVLAPAN